jgi:hypothetical protein
MKKKFLLGLVGNERPMDFSAKVRSFPKLLDGKRSTGAQQVEHTIYESQWIVFKTVYTIVPLEKMKKILMESTLELSVFGINVSDGIVEDSRQSWTLNGPIQREVIKRILGFYQY